VVCCSFLLYMSVFCLIVLNIVVVDCISMEDETNKMNNQKLFMSKTDNIYRHVAVEGAVKDWACYVGSIIDSVEKVRNYGDKISETRARKLFPEFNHLRWRP